jgi:hypothetical protein
MITINGFRLPHGTLLVKIRLRQSRRYSIVLGAYDIQRPELSIVGNVFGGCVESGERRRLQVGGVGAGLPSLEQVVQGTLGRIVNKIVVPEDAASALEAEPRWRDLANVGAGAGELGNVG